MTKKNQKDKKIKIQEWPLPFCTKSARPRNTTGSADNDEPCDDARAIGIRRRKGKTWGKIDEK
jgi:hypothetical protein